MQLCFLHLSSIPTFCIELVKYQSKIKFIPDVLYTHSSGMKNITVLTLNFPGTRTTNVSWPTPCELFGS
jgi:hypothetical protein